MTASGASRCVLHALSTLLGLHLRAFLPQVVYVYGARPDVSSVDMGRLAIGVFLTAFLVAVPHRILGTTRALQVTAAVLALARLLAPVMAPGTSFVLITLGTIAFLWHMPLLFAATRGGGPEAGTRGIRHRAAGADVAPRLLDLGHRRRRTLVAIAVSLPSCGRSCFAHQRCRCPAQTTARRTTMVWGLDRFFSTCCCFKHRADLVVTGGRRRVGFWGAGDGSAARPDRSSIAGAAGGPGVDPGRVEGPRRRS
jgi:hypothetical protein